MGAQAGVPATDDGQRGPAAYDPPGCYFEVSKPDLLHEHDVAVYMIRPLIKVESLVSLTTMSCSKLSIAQGKTLYYNVGGSNSGHCSPEDKCVCRHGSGLATGPYLPPSLPYSH